MKNPNTTPMKLTERGNKVIAGLTATVFVAAGLGAVLAIERGNNNARHAERVEAQEAIDTPVLKSILLKSGTELRRTPTVLNGLNDVDIDNKAGEIPKGKDWIVQAPLVDLEKPDWIAFTLPGTEKDIHNVSDRAGETVWVQYSVVNSHKGGILDWKFNADGIVSINGNISPEIGTSVEVSESSRAVVSDLLDQK